MVKQLKKVSHQIHLKLTKNLFKKTGVKTLLNKSALLLFKSSKLD